MLGSLGLSLRRFFGTHLRLVDSSITNDRKLADISLRTSGSLRTYLIRKCTYVATILLQHLRYTESQQYKLQGRDNLGSRVYPARYAPEDDVITSLHVI